MKTIKSPNQIYAAHVLKELNKLISKAKRTTYNWDKACRTKQYHLHNCIYSLQRKPLNKNWTIYDYLNNLYKEVLSNALSLTPSGELKDPNWIQFQELLLKLPPRFKDLFTNTFDPEIIRNISLWNYIEDLEISFDLGDDGTDEAEQDLERLAWLIEITQSQNIDWEKEGTYTLLHNIAKLTMKYEIFSDGVYISFDINDISMLLTLLKDTQTYDELFRYFIDFLNRDRITSTPF